MIFGIKTLKFAEIQKIVQNKSKTKKNKNKEKKKLGPKMPYLSILGCKFAKLLSYFQHPQIFQNAKFHVKLKILNFRTKNVLLGVFRLRF